MWGIIGGSGFEKFDGFEVIEELSCETPFGLASSGFKRVRVEGEECLFISRHGAHHELLPSEVNYRANIYALKKMGAKSVISFSAIGSLKKELAPGDMVVPSQYIDRTKGLRAHTFCGEGIVGHVSLAHPTCEKVTTALKDFQPQLKKHFHKTYICIEGPYFSSKAESNLYRSFGADVIGMTHFPEYALAREAGLHYVPCCFVTDYDCWDESIPHVTLEEVLEVMRKNNEKAYRLLCDVVRTKDQLYKECSCSQGGLSTGILTPEELWPEKLKPVFQVLTK